MYQFKSLLILLMLVHLDLNTLYVSVQEYTKCLKIIGLDLNTLYVSVQENRDGAIGIINAFKYIICISSSWIAKDRRY